ncbi:glycosyltransferase family 2 protein [Parathalassolituus penaei]|uniref:Glycosyltransferase family 2 protein n=1 Tax=Parathalassolituus penaei TaxID=2997323 RepID=A0A9X3EM82_9GAMM|nr:glycosyltransferase family 2 protein [Parathalassolituus penaei]MCY0966946.1 glycosyltransferase family 2 protein [Parathalassolituus penaei]
MSISAIILTKNEKLHIERCIKSLTDAGISVFVIDSGSSDGTIEIAERLGAQVFYNQWKNYADQFQWGLDNCPINTEWVMRMDADEYLEPDLIDEVRTGLISVPSNISGLYIRRKYFFLGQWIKKGAVYPLNLLRIWRNGKGRIEARWMDEHIVLSGDGNTMFLNGHIVDDNLNNTRWYIDKHNRYADREMIDIVGRKYDLFEQDESIAKDSSNNQARIKRFVKERVYNSLPVFIRPTFYFLYRYFIRLGFMDGVKGFAFHFMQGFWYRTLVDLRVYEAEMQMKHCQSKAERVQILKDLTGLDL